MKQQVLVTHESMSKAGNRFGSMVKFANDDDGGDDDYKNIHTLVPTF